MKTTRNILTGLTISLTLSGVIAFAGGTGPPRSIEDRVRHELLGVPYINVFDDLTYSVDNGVVTLSGQVTRPIEKYNAEQAVKNVDGVTRVANQIEVLPLSPFDDRIRAATLRALVRSASLYRYFLGVNPSIRILVKNGNVTLDGVVLDPADRQLAYMAANGVSGVFSVTNNLRTEK
jgi:hyperosmotically inducible protein